MRENLFWNRTATDRVSSKTTAEEVGSIHTIQGNDLNNEGVIIGSDLSFDKNLNRIVFNRANYFDVKGRENKDKLGLEYTDEAIKQYVLNIYRVLLTRGILGTHALCARPRPSGAPESFSGLGLSPNLPNHHPPSS